MTDSKAVSTKLKPILAQHKLLADYWLISFNATQSAIKAGYKKKTAYSMGSRVLKRVEVKAYIDEQIEELAMGYTERLFALGHIAKAANKDTDRLKAIELLGKLSQDYTKKIDMTSNGETMGVMLYLPENGRD